MQTRLGRVARVGVGAALLMSVAVMSSAESLLNANASMRDNLTALMASKKPVTVVLKNGQSYRAAIGAVGDHMVVLSGPAQKEFYDVLVPIDEIAAVEARARE